MSVHAVFSASRTRVLLVAAGLVSVHSTVAWMARRAVDGSDEAVGWVALVAAVVLLIARRRPVPPSPPLALPALAFLAYGVSSRLFTPLPSAFVAMTALALLLSPLFLGRRLDLGLLGCLWLSLPLVASLQFYCSYPLRVAVANSAAVLLSLSGLSVAAEGVGLRHVEYVAMVDAPCSGLKMLWAGGLVTSVAIGWLRLRPSRALGAFAGAFIVLFLANVIRAAALVREDLNDWESWPGHAFVAGGHGHSLVGLVVFAVAAVVIVRGVQWLAKGDRQTSAIGSMPGRSYRVLAFVMLLSVVAVCPAMAKPGPSAAADEQAFPGWPERFRAPGMTELALERTEQRFAEGFPGRVGKFSDGRRRYIVRFVARPTRRLHPAADCFRASGYAVSALASCPPGAAVGGCSLATKGGRRLLIHEHISDASLRTFGDVSQWYWASLAGETQGPWWSVTTVATAPPGT